MQTTCSSLIGLRAFANNCGIPLASVLDFKPVQDIPQVLQAPAPPPRCRNCRAFWSQYCMVNLSKQTWHCAVCGVGNISKSALADPNPTSYLELYNETVEYRVGRQEDPLVPHPRKHVVVAVDGSMDAPLLASWRAAILTTFKRELEPSTLVSVIIFDGAVTVADMSECRQQVSSVVLPGSTSLNKAAFHELLAQPGLFCAEYGASANQLEAILSSIRPFEAQMPMRLRSRSTMVAIEAGLELLSTSALACVEGAGPQAQLAPGSRLLVCLGGPATKGPGSLPLSFLDSTEKPPKALQKQMQDSEAHAARLASAAGLMGAAIDIFLGTEAGVNVPLLKHLVDGSRGGQLYAQRGFGRSLAPALKACLSGCIGTRGTMDVFCSDGLRLAQCIGALDEQQKLGLPVSPPGPWLSPSACYIGDLVAGRGVVARFELQHDLLCSEPEKPSFAHIQVVLYYHDARTHELVARVSSKRLEVVSRAGQFLRSVDAPLAAVVAAKRLALDARSSGAQGGDPKKLESVRLGVSAQVALIASRFGKDVQVSSGLLGLGARKERQWPPELLPLAHGLYNLQRSPMLAGPAMLPYAVHPDERLLLMLQLLAAGCAASVAQVLPALYAVLPEQRSAAGAAQDAGQPRQPESPAQTLPAGSVATARGESMQLALVELGAPPLSIVGMAALGQAPQAGQPGGQHSIPLLLDTGPVHLLLNPPAAQQHVEAVAELALGAAARVHRTPCLRLVHRATQAAQQGPAPGEEQQGPGSRVSGLASEEEFLAALHPAHMDTWPQQQAQLEQGGTGTWAWMIMQGRDDSRCAILSEAVGGRLRGVVCPSFLQWGKSMGITFV